MKYPIKKHLKIFKNLENKQVYQENTWLLIPKKILKLIDDFINYKLEYGSKKEIELYKTMTQKMFIKRLFKKRPLSFIGTSDRYLLRDGITSGCGNKWMTIGKDCEKSPLILEDYLSYDEIEIGVFISLSCFTPFLNNGSRYNEGEITENHEPEGIYIGQVGARFEVPKIMEWKYMIIDSSQNTYENGYGPDNNNIKGKYLSIWADFYEIDHFPTYDEYIKENNIKKEKNILNEEIYKKRIKINAEIFLKEANSRARKHKKMAFCHIVGLGLGEWKFDKYLQEKITVDTYIELLEENDFKYISNVYFCYFNYNNFPKFVGHIEIESGKRNVANPLNNDLLLVANWPWDANSYVGNEFWLGLLSDSGDPAAASCSFIGIIGNPSICDIDKIRVF